jgi:hypothetical protein
MIHWIAAAHIADRPLTATEWNVESFPVPDRHASRFLLPVLRACKGRTH